MWRQQRVIVFTGERSAERRVSATRMGDSEVRRIGPGREANIKMADKMGNARSVPVAGNATTSTASSRFAPAQPRPCCKAALSSLAPSFSLLAPTALFSPIPPSTYFHPRLSWTPIQKLLRLAEEEEVAVAASEVGGAEGRVDEAVDAAQSPSTAKTARSTPSTSRPPGSRRSSTRTTLLPPKRSKSRPSSKRPRNLTVGAVGVGVGAGADVDVVGDTGDAVAGAEEGVARQHKTTPSTRMRTQVNRLPRIARLDLLGRHGTVLLGSS